MLKMEWVILLLLGSSYRPKNVQILGLLIISPLLQFLRDEFKSNIILLVEGSLIA